MLSKTLRILFSLLLGLALNGCGGGGSGNLLYNPTPVPILSVSDGPIYDFGNHLVDSETQRVFTVSNIGGGTAIDISSSFYFSLSFSFTGGTYPGTGGTCSDKLEAGADCSVVVSFTPKSLGDAQATLQLSYFNGSTQVSSSSPLLVGTGI